MANESFIEVLERIITAPVLATGTNTLKVGALIVSPVGDSEPKLITTPLELLNEYTESGVLTPDSHPTLLSAYRLASSCDLIVTRCLPANIAINYYAPNSATVIAATDLATESANHGFMVRFNNVVTNLEASSTTSRENIIIEAIAADKTYQITHNTIVYTASLNPTAVDANGVSTYILNLNETLPLTFSLGGLAEDTLTWTDSTTTIYNVPVTHDETDVATWVAAGADVLAEQEIDLIDILSDLSYHHVTYQSTLANLRDDLNTTAILGFPESAVTKALIDAHIASIGVTGSDIVAVAQTERLSSWTGFYTAYSLSLLWIEKLAANKAILQEFAPMHGPQNATVVPGTLNVKFKTKTARQALLDSNVVTLKTFKGASYFNDNTTFLTSTNVFSESQNRLFQRKSSRDIAYLMRQFEGQENTTETRSNVVDLIEDYFTKVVAPQKFRPQEWDIVCDKTNNLDSTIRANELHITVRVRYRNSIKFVKLLTEAYPVGVAFSA